jgi:hypothetical protein
MNERIRQLAIEAKLIASEPNGFDQNNLSKAQQKFAELIIIDVCNTLSEISNDDRIEKTTTDHMTKLFNGILEHVSEFLKEKYNVGVEE